MSVFLMLLAALQSAPEPALSLTCGGGGSATRNDATTAYGGNSNGVSAWATVNSRRSERFEDQVDLVIDGAASRIRLPRTMLPPLHGGDNGWFKLKAVEVSPSGIKGSASVNAINNPKVYIDRRTGTISIDGKAGHYVGRCERTETTQPVKF